MNMNQQDLQQLALLINQQNQTQPPQKQKGKKSKTRKQSQNMNPTWEAFKNFMAVILVLIIIAIVINAAQNPTP